MAVDHLLTSTQSSTLHIADPPGSELLPTNFRATVPLFLVAFIVLVLEQKRKGGLPDLPGLAACGRVFRQLFPELLVLSLCIVVAGVLIVRGVHLGSAIEGADDEKIWAAINSEWPVLQTADTLLGLQAMLRIVLLGSLAARASNQGAMATFVGAPAAMLLLGAVARVALLGLSPRDVYHLDGPLGGWMNVVLEVAALPPLMYLSCLSKNLKQLGGVTTAAALLATGVAVRHHFSLAEPRQSYLDVLFSMEHLFEFMAALALLCTTCATREETATKQPFAGSSVLAARFAYWVLPLMQLLPAYFIVFAWGEPPFQPVPNLVGAGHPFELLQALGSLEVVTYVLAGVIHLAVTGGDEEQEPLLIVEV